jgi:hypothetical protein
LSKLKLIYKNKTPSKKSEEFNKKNN